MRPVNRFRHLVTAELTKIRTIRSTKWALVLTLLICVCLGYAASLSLRVSFPRLPPQQRRDFDPIFATFYSISLGQLALVVFGVTVVGSEYTSGTIVTSLTAVPRRGLFYAAKLAAGLLAAAVAALVTVTATFFAAQQALIHHAPVTDESFVALALAPFVLRELHGVIAVAQEFAAVVAIHRPLHLHSLAGLENSEKRNQVALERVVMHGIGVFQIGRHHIESARDKSAAIQSLENNHVIPEVTINRF